MLHNLEINDQNISSDIENKLKIKNDRVEKEIGATVGEAK